MPGSCDAKGDPVLGSCDAVGGSCAWFMRRGTGRQHHIAGPCKHADRRSARCDGPEAFRGVLIAPMRKT